MMPVALFVIVPEIVTVLPEVTEVGVTVMVSVGVGSAVVMLTVTTEELTAAYALLPAQDARNV